MRRNAILFGTALLLALGIGFAQEKDTKDKAQAPETAPPPVSADDAGKKNPVKPTPEGLAEAKRLYGYHCAMCHGKDGDGKGDLAVSMDLKLHDWRDPSTIEKMTDGELFYIITNGRGKMVGGEGDRTKEQTRWNLVNLVRSFGKKSGT
ncbi:MAG: cytochrome c [Candidatus Acidiferrum sp.]